MNRIEHEAAPFGQHKADDTKAKHTHVLSRSIILCMILCEVCQIIFAILKLSKVIAWPWMVVLIPLWTMLAIIMAIFTLMALSEMIKNQRK